MQFSNFSDLSLSALKALATTKNVVPTGDKRSKKAWIDALELASQPTDAEMECIAVAVDMATTADSEHVSVTDYTDMPETTAQQDAPAPSPNKKGAATVFGSLLMILILTVHAVLCIGSTIAKAAIHFKNLFGGYNPDYDLWYQLNTLAQGRKLKLDIACA